VEEGWRLGLFPAVPKVTRSLPSAKIGKWAVCLSVYPPSTYGTTFPGGRYVAVEMADALTFAQ